MIQSQSSIQDAVFVEASRSIHLYTCMSCLVGFHSPLDQRTHYRSDLHRYNMKRQVAGLLPVRQDVFEQKIQQIQGDATNFCTSMSMKARPSSAKINSQRARCQQCSKSFASSNSYASHLVSRKHKDTVARLAAVSNISNKASVNALASTVANSDNNSLVFRISASADSTFTGVAAPLESLEEVKQSLSNPTSQPADPNRSLVTATKSAVQALTSPTIAQDATDAEVKGDVVSRRSSATRIDPAKQCIFCPTSGFVDLDASLEHMQRQHGFFIPEQSYLTDLPGLAEYLADKVSVGHLCLYCNGRGRGFSTAEAARKHMRDKYHCKVAYDYEDDQLELSDFYDFSSSYPDYKAGQAEDDSGEEWENMDEYEADDGADASDDEGHDSDAEDFAANGLRYGDSELELVLPSGARLGHRSLARYYRQTLFSTPATAYRGSGGAVARRLIDQSRAQARGSDLVVRDRNRGEVRARNRGEAKEAKRHIREFRDMARREHFRTQVGYRHNDQKHFRDPLLQ